MPVRLIRRCGFSLWIWIQYINRTWSCYRGCESTRSSRWNLPRFWPHTRTPYVRRLRDWRCRGVFATFNSQSLSRSRCYSHGYAIHFKRFHRSLNSENRIHWWSEMGCFSTCSPWARPPCPPKNSWSIRQYSSCKPCFRGSPLLLSSSPWYCPWYQLDCRPWAHWWCLFRQSQGVECATRSWCCMGYHYLFSCWSWAYHSCRCSDCSGRRSSFGDS